MKISQQLRQAYVDSRVAGHMRTSIAGVVFAQEELEGLVGYKLHPLQNGRSIVQEDGSILFSIRVPA